MTTIRYVIDCFGGNVIHSATSIYRTKKVFWIRFTHCFFTACSYFSLQTVFKKLLKKPNLVYLKWMLKSHCWLRLTNWEQISILTNKNLKIYSTLSWVKLCESQHFWQRWAELRIFARLGDKFRIESRAVLQQWRILLQKSKWHPKFKPFAVNDYSMQHIIDVWKWSRILLWSWKLM